MLQGSKAGRERGEVTADKRRSDMLHDRTDGGDADSLSQTAADNANVTF